MQIVHFERQTTPGNHSIERVFEAVRGALPRDWELDVVHCPTPQHSSWWLLQGIARAWAKKGEVNHIVGDVHYVALGLPGSRCILTVHDFNRLDQLRGLRRLLYRWVYFSIPLKRCAIVTAISESTRDRIATEFSFASDKIFVIPNPVPEGYVSRPKPFNVNFPRILQVGTAPNKNLNRLIQAINGQPCKLRIIGLLDDEQLKFLKESEVDYQNVVNITDIEVLQEYDQADLVVFVSLAEGFGMPIIEAQAIGRPVIVSNLSPMKEVAGVGALTVDPFDVSAIRSAIRQVIEDGRFRQSIIAAGLENAERYSVNEVAGQYARMYERVASLR